MLGWPLKWAKNNFAGNTSVASSKPLQRSWRNCFLGGDIMRGFRLALITDSRGRGIKGLARADNDVRKLLKTK